MRFSLRTLLLVFLFVAASLAGGLWLSRQLEEGVLVAYASWGCGDLLVDYLESNSDRWPRNWEELEAFYVASGRRYVGLESFADVELNFEIDFTFDPATDTQSWIADPVPERVVRYRSGGASYVAGREANSRILLYLTEHQSDLQTGS